MAFIDEVKLELSAGKGGDGVVRWRQEKFKPLAGPGGGNAGNGGDIYVKAVNDNMALSYYRVKKVFQAENGQNGGNKGKEGLSGQDLVLNFPIGTIITNTETGEKIELLQEGQTVKLLKGGVGGFGNEHFKGSKNTAPEQSTKGKLGQKGIFSIELLISADIGLVGMPNAGKSSLLNALSNATAKIGDYPFTTIEPNLGVCDGLVIADIPGLIEGASLGKGLGDKFLKHIMRTKALVHLISAENENQVQDYRIIKKELANFNSSLLEKKSLIVLSKNDTIDKNKEKEIIKKLEKESKSKIISVSAFDDASLDLLKIELKKLAGN